MIALLSLAFLALWGFYMAYPRFDLVLTSLFYDPTHPDRFALMYNPTLRFIQKGVHWLTYGLIALPFALLWLQRQWPSRYAKLQFTWRMGVCMLLAMALGPGLVVHEGFKEVFERPRPAHSDVFGGEYPFQPPMVMGDHGGKSFVSGHAAMGFYLSVLALLAHTRRKQALLYAAGIGFGLLLGGCRIIQGRHFLSDILFSGIVTLLCIHLAFIITHKCFTKRPNHKSSTGA